MQVQSIGHTMAEAAVAHSSEGYNPPVLMKGAVAGAVATFFMSAFMIGSRAFGMNSKLPPRKITEAAIRAVEPAADPAAVKALSVVNHFAFGMAAGALYAWSQERLGLRRAPIARGASFGLLVWTASYFGWVPALGIMPPAHRDHPSRAKMMAAAHVVYGSVLAQLAR